MTKKEELRIEYFRQRRRIQGTKRRYKKQGFEVDFELPKIPKNITQASVNRLEKIETDTRKVYICRPIDRRRTFLFSR